MVWERASVVKFFIFLICICMRLLFDYYCLPDNRKRLLFTHMNTWTPLWSLIVESSLWEENGDVVKVFMTLLARKNSDHICELDAFRIAKLCNFRLPDGSIDELKTLDILKVLASPDTRRKAEQEFEGKRIKAVEGGWLVLNGEKYRRMVSEEMKKARNRRSQETYRRNHPVKRFHPHSGGSRAENLDANQ